MKRLILGIVAMLLAVAAFAGTHQFQTVPNDPLQTKMYTLPNGLKLFMSVNKDQPRLQTIIAVRVGGKNDPAETTGLAHYFEHLMFKGTERFGTSNYTAEKPMLDQIERLFETYRVTTDSAARREIYRTIDSISYEASKLAIPNEYDKLMSAIGASGTNAYTSVDMTCYVEDIPSNQLENWARIEADRFEHPVIRGFHTELETIYEEKNMSLTKDPRKVYEKMLSTLYPSHPYGSQTVLGSQEHLKNPSITNVKAYHKNWYVPNNMAIILAGDFDPDTAVDVIEKYFGHLQPNPTVDAGRPALPREEPITTPKHIEVLGPDAENVTLAWRMPEAASKDMTAIKVLDFLMANGSTGILDVNVNLPQLTLSAGAGVNEMADASLFTMSGRAKDGQTLEQVRDILLAQVAKLRNGEFTDELLEAVKANLALQVEQTLASNYSRANVYENAFINGIEWADVVADLDNLGKVTKQDVVDMANKYLGENSYIEIFKLQGQDPNELKIAKPQLTPIVTNRDMASDFLKEIQASEVAPIEPVFVDFKKDLTILKGKNNVEVIYVPNTTNKLFDLTFVYKVGTNEDQILSYAAALSDYIGTSTMTPEQVKNEFYKLACSMNISSGADFTYVIVSGLDANMEKALRLTEKVLADATISQDAYDAYIGRYEKSRANAKLNQQQNFARLQQYVTYGPKNSATEALSPEQLRNMKPAELMAAIRKLNDYEQSVVYWGNMKQKNLVKLIDKIHPSAKKPLAATKERRYKEVAPTETTFYIAPYEAKQLYMTGFSMLPEDKFDRAKEPMLSIYNEYFGGSMGSIVFQEMREARSLAYSAGAYYSSPRRTDRNYTYRSSIATQNDKLLDALAAFDEIINKMPRSEAAFDLAKQSLEANLRTQRLIHDNKAYAYINGKLAGYDYDSRRDLYEALPTATMDAVADFQQRNVKDRIFNYGILAKPENIDIEALRKLGKVVILTQEDIFGY